MPPETDQTSPSPLKVFLSYSRADRARVEPLAKALKQAGVEVWWDSDLRGGSVFPEEIERALEDATAVVVVWSAASVKSHWVQDEAGRGRDRTRLVPIMIDPVLPPLGFGQYHVIDFTRWRDGDDPAALEALLAALEIASGAALPARQALRGGFLTRRRLVYGVGGGLGAVGLVVAGVVTLTQMGGAGSGGAKHIAVLPFDNLTGDPGQDYIPKGLAEEIRAQLGDVPGFRLLGRVTTLDVAGQGGSDPRRVLKALGADYLLSGSFRSLSGVARIDAETIDATGLSVIRKQYDRQVGDLLSLEADIAQEYAQALVQQLAPQSSIKSGGDGTHNKAARDAYLRGLVKETSETETDLRSAVSHFQKAVTLDPHYAAAQAALARSSMTLAMNFAPAPEATVLLTQAIAAAEAALRLAPTLADAQSTIGYIRFFGQLDAKAAKGPFEQAYRTGGGQARILSRFAAYAYRVGRFAEAETAMTGAVSLDARNPQIHRNLGLMRIAQRRFQDARAPFEDALRINPQLPSARAYVGLAALGLGKLDEARAAFALDPESEISWVGLAILNHRIGKGAEARAAFQKLVSEGDRSLYQQAQVQAQWGQSEAALTLLERALGSKDTGMINIGVDFSLDPVRQDPRFLKLLSAIGLA